MVVKSHWRSFSFLLVILFFICACGDAPSKGNEKPDKLILNAPLNNDLVFVGEKAFIETAISTTGNHSCGGPNGCHNLSKAGFADGPIATGMGGININGKRIPDISLLREQLDISGCTPSIIKCGHCDLVTSSGKLGYSKAFEWDQCYNENLPEIIRKENLTKDRGDRVQGKVGGVVHSLANFNRSISDSLGYTEYLKRALPKMPDSLLFSGFGLSYAIAEFERRYSVDYITDTKFYRVEYLKQGNYTLWESKGRELFKENCQGCHTEKGAFGSDQFHLITNDSRISLKAEDRFVVTGKEPDKGKKITPSLFGVHTKNYYGHNNQWRNPQESIKGHGLGISDIEILKLEAWLNTL